MATQDLVQYRAALDEARAWQASERERRIGLAYVVTGACSLLTFGAYGAMQAANVQAPWIVWGALWIPFVVAARVLRRKLFHHLPTPAEDVTRLPNAMLYVFGAMWLVTPWLVGGYLGQVLLIWPAVIAIFGLMYLTQSAFHHDRLTAALGVGTLALAGALAVGRVSVPNAAFVAAVFVGGSLAAIGVWRRWRARA